MSKKPPLPIRIHRFLRRVLRYWFAFVWFLQKPFVWLRRRFQRLLLSDRVVRLVRGYGEKAGRFDQKVIASKQRVGVASDRAFGRVMTASIIRRTLFVTSKLRFFVLYFASLPAAAFQSLLGRLMQIGWVRRLLAPTIAASKVMGKFALHWFFTRSLKTLLNGIPALVFVVPLMALMVLIPLYSSGSKASHYRQAFKDAFNAEDYESANLYRQKLTQLGDVNEASLYQQAMALQQSEGWDAAFEQMRALAPTDKPGYAPAHYWIAMAILEQKLLQNDTSRWQIAEQHLDHAIQLVPDSPDLRSMRASLYHATNRVEKATSELASVAKSHPEFAFSLMQLDNTYGSTDETQSAALRLKRYYEAEIDRNNDLTASSYLRWALAEESLGQRKDARQVLENGLQLFANDSGLKRGLLQLLAKSFDSALPPSSLSTSTNRADERFDSLSRMMELHASHRLVVQRVMGLARSWSAGDRSAGELLQKLIETHHQESLVHSAKGIEAMRIKDYPSARESFAAALEIDPDSPDCQNNLAWSLCYGEPGDIEAALSLVNQAIESNSENPQFRETRGQVYLKLKNWSAAIVDFEKALSAMPNDKGIHESLAQALDGAGQSQLAQVHRKMAN